MYLLEELWEYVEVNAVTVTLTAIVLLLFCWPKILEKHRYPPGPIPLPFIGNSYVMFSDNKPLYRYRKWNSCYGNVVSHVLFGDWAVELYGYDAIYEAFVTKGEYFSERMPFSVALGFMQDGLIFSPNWKELRRQALTILRDHGMGKIGMETKIVEEQEYLMDALSNLKGIQSSKTFKLTVGNAVSNIINQVVFGHRLEYGDPDLEGLLHFEAYFLAQLRASIIPFYKYLPWDPLKLQQLIQYHNHANAFFAAEIKLHRDNLDINQPRDYIDSFLAEGIKTGNPIFTNEVDLAGTISQLYIAGYDTTSTTLTWSLLYLINYPNCKQMIYKEIQQTIGGRTVSWNDRESMNYTQAFINEVLRVSSMTGTTISHMCTADTVIQGCTIPKGTRIGANLYSTYHDETVFPDSYSFKPQRFLDDSGVFIKPTGKQMLPFGIGKRACIGEGLARTELFMFLVSMVQRFEVEGVGGAKVSEDGIDVFTHSPRPFEFVLKRRD